MTNPNAHDIKVLNGLIDTTLDSADGYREAAEQTQDPHYRTLFERRAGERQQVVEDLSAAWAAIPNRTAPSWPRRTAPFLM